GLQELPVDLFGRASANGVLTGTFRAPQTSGHLLVEDFATRIPVNQAPGTTQANAIRWQRLETDYSVQPSAVSVLHGNLSRGRSQIAFDVSSELKHFSMQPQSRMRAHVQASHISIAEFQNLLGYDYPVSGDLDLQAEIQGTRVSPSGHVALSASEVEM